MKVWIENPFDNLPIEGFRPQRFWLMAEAFAAAGHDVTLWTSDFNHTTKKKRVSSGEFRVASRDGRGAKSNDDGNGLERRNTKLATPNFTCIQVPSIPYFSNVSLRRMFSHWRYAAKWDGMARRHASEKSKPDVIIVSTPPLSTGAVARRLAKEYSACLVFDVMDAWPETFERIAPRWMLSPLRAVARRNYLSADLVTTVADRYIDLVRSYGYIGPTRRFYHGIDMAAATAKAPVMRNADAAHGQSCIRLAYIGNLGRTYDLETVVKALEAMPGAILEIAGQGEQEAMLRRAAAQNPRIIFHGYLGGGELSAMLRRCHIGIVPMAPESCVGVPYKFADYSRASLAIVSSLGGESSRLLEKYGAGKSYAAGDPKSLSNAIADIVTSLESRRSAAFALAQSEFSASAIYSAYVAEVEQLCRSPGDKADAGSPAN